VALIIVDAGGSWYGSKLLRSGIHETTDRALIEEARNSGLDWVTVTEDDDQGVELPRVNDKPVVQTLVETPPADAPALRALTSDELAHPNTRCDICQRDFSSLAAAQSHRRGKHPELDQTTGLPREARPAATPADEPEVMTVAGGDATVPGLPTDQEPTGTVVAGPRGDTPVDAPQPYAGEQPTAQPPVPVELSPAPLPGPPIPGGELGAPSNA
jgi:hypothetical protein